MNSLISKQDKRTIHPNSLANLEKGKFKKGQVTNPNGRPKKDYTITSVIKEMLNLPCDAAIPGADGVKTWRQLIARAIVYGAAKGNPQMIKELLDRTDGKVLQPIGGEDGEPIKYDITVKDGESKKLTEQLFKGGAVVSNICLS